MSLDALLHFISSSPNQNSTDSDLAFAEISPAGSILSLNSLARLAWEWRVGSILPTDLQMALECLTSDSPVELPLTLGGLHLKGLSKGSGDGWFIVGYEPENSTTKGDQFSFRTLMDRIPQPAVCINTSGLSKYVNEATAREFLASPHQLVGRPILSELIHPEDRWKLADLMEMAARDGSSHASVRFGRSSNIGVLHMVRSVSDEFQAVILSLGDDTNLVDGSYVQESIYQSFLEQGPIGVLYLDAEGRVTFENHYFRELVGEDPDASWLGLKLRDIRHLSRESADKLVSAAKERKARILQIDLLDPATRTVNRHIQVHASGIVHPDGNVIGATLLIEDRTEWVHREHELARLELSEKLKSGLRELATTSPDPRIFRDAAIALMGEALGAIRSSLLGLSVGKDRMVEISGWSRSYDHQVPESIDREELAYFEGTFKGQYLRHSDLDGFGICDRLEADNCWISPVHDNAQFAGFLVFGWDRSEAEPDTTRVAFLNDIIALFESLYSWIQLGARYRTTVASIDDALFGFSFFKDGTRRYHFATEQFAILTGYQPSQVMQYGDQAVDWVSEVVHEEDASLLRTHNLTLLEGHESRITYRIYHRDGSIRWLREHATPRRDATGMTAVNGIISDVSEQKAAELVLLQAKKEAEISDRSKTAFIATMSHEIRTPLGAVHGFAQLLEKEMEEFEEELSVDLPEQVHEFISAISERSQKLLSLVDDLFELSNIEMGKVSIRQLRVPLSGIVRAAAEKARSAATRKGLDLHLSVHDSEIQILGEHKRVAQILDNLLSNAVKFTEEGGISVRLDVRGDAAVIEVEDTGVGISTDYQANLFEAFSQEEEWRNRKYEGTGLGLALVNRLVEFMNGRIEVQSEKGVGSTFRVSFPLVQDSVQTPPARFPEHTARFE
jgi:PAS domain S-box-containing protein